MVKRAIVMAISVLLALILAAPIAFGQQASSSAGIGGITDNWWNWAFENPTATSPLLGSYSGGEQCDGFQQGNETGVWFLGAEFSIEGDGQTGFVAEAKRHCTVPADTPILFPVFNINCGEAPTVRDPETGTLTGDPKPYTTCAQTNVDDALEFPSTEFATINGTDLPITRAASPGLFTWVVPTVDNPQGVAAGSYKSATDGHWVYLPDGLAPGNYTIHFGGSYNPFEEVSFVVDITYKLKVQ